MKILSIAKDGGPQSNTTGYWLLEIKWLFSIVLLRFSKGTRENFHNHAFNAISWVLFGTLLEERKLPYDIFSYKYLLSSLMPIITTKNNLHRGYGVSDNTRVLSFRGPWNLTWKEWVPKFNTYVFLTNGRKIV
jgi:hypothetical protein